jgi:hypothetical protein
MDNPNNGKIAQKMLSTSVIKKLLKVKDHPKGENSSILVSLSSNNE